jgi:hypothetical protein
VFEFFLLILTDFLLNLYFKVKRDREISSQPNSPSTSSPMYKKQMTVSAKTILNSPQKAPQSPLCSPRKVDTRTRSQIMLEEIVGKKTGVRNLSKEMLKKQLEKSGKLNELKSKIGEIKDIDARLKAIREKSPKKSTINLKVRPAPTPLDADAPCYVKYRHLADEGVMDKMRLPSHYQLLAEQFETTDSQTATLYNRGLFFDFENQVLSNLAIVYMDKTTKIWPFSKTRCLYMDKRTLYKCIEGEKFTNNDRYNVA